MIRSHSAYLSDRIMNQNTVWRIMAQDMEQRGMSLCRQAAEIDKEWSTYQRWLNGSQPRYFDALLIIELHSMVCGKEITQSRLTAT